MRDDESPESQTRNAVVMILIIVALVGGFFLARHLMAQARLEDCLMSGRRNCAPIDSTTGAIQPPH